MGACRCPRFCEIILAKQIKFNYNSAMSNATQYLDQLAAALNAARLADNQQLISSIGGIAKNVHISLSSGGILEQTEEFKKGVVEWFLKGKLTTYRKVSVPYGERKNSKKKQTTQFFCAERDGLFVQLGHKTTKNYQPCFWERGAENLVKSALCKAGEFSYHNESFVDYALQLGAKFEDLGEK